MFNHYWVFVIITYSIPKSFAVSFSARIQTVSSGQSGKNIVRAQISDGTKTYSTNNPEEVYKMMGTLMNDNVNIFDKMTNHDDSSQPKGNFMIRDDGRIPPGLNLEPDMMEDYSGMSPFDHQFNFRRALEPHDQTPLDDHNLFGEDLYVPYQPDQDNIRSKIPNNQALFMDFMNACLGCYLKAQQEFPRNPYRRTLEGNGWRRIMPSSERRFLQPQGRKIPTRRTEQTSFVSNPEEEDTTTEESTQDEKETLSNEYSRQVDDYSSYSPPSRRLMITKNSAYFSRGQKTN